MEAVMVRYGEVFLKSEQVKRRFIAQMAKNIRLALEAASLGHRIETPRGRILIYGDDPASIADTVTRIFGVVDVSVATVTTPDIAHLSGVAVERAKTALQPGMTFAVRGRRSGVEGFSSQELAGTVGAAIGQAVPEASVNLSKPDYEVFVEARDFGGFVYDSRQPGPGGLPFGTQGRVLTLLSAGIDSPVASWLMMRRGCGMIHLHMRGGRFAGGDVEETALRHHAQISRWCPGYPLDLFVVEMEPFFEALVRLKEPRYRCILCKRFMLKVASEVARRHAAHAIVSGDNLGQVASQTLENMAVIAPAATVPVLRPLIGFDKEEIVAQARMIGTFDPVQGELGCTVAPKHPSIAARAEIIAEYEKLLGMEELVSAAVEKVVRRRAQSGTLVEIS
ncbi:tRNA 4-thiouridine(8) synthase ThiI [Methanoculleus sp. FWC-SCC1]|uniref:Probable tRNA sulfurtransferase n=1 Tax=Methanoculleus frigidifontis TaxID=2584085 RepID=A0ABT8M7M7_9EURY|nr:tRNA uracil 4-sulfurtransferase ThiI [Methanoculleus sp. FWC-SCC1]MDN7023938.1 tRNA 4-thiouridine(8) synthase ThiI [Methanoculleus sp. FWC-SCC1]